MTKYMNDFKTFLSDFSHLISGASSVASGMKSEIDNNVQSIFNTLALQAGFVRRDEFNTLCERFEQAAESIKNLEAKINDIINHSNSNQHTLKD